MKTDYRLTAVSLAVLVFAALMMLSASSPQKLIRAQAFHLINESGEVRGSLSLDEKGNPHLQLIDNKDNVRLGVLIFNDKISINLLDKGKTKASLGEERMVLHGKDSSAFVTIDKSGNAQFFLIYNGKGVWGVP